MSELKPLPSELLSHKFCPQRRSHPHLAACTSETATLELQRGLNIAPDQSHRFLPSSFPASPRGLPSSSGTAGEGGPRAPLERGHSECAHSRTVSDAETPPGRIPSPPHTAPPSSGPGPPAQRREGVLSQRALLCLCGKDISSLEDTTWPAASSTVSKGTAMAAGCCRPVLGPCAGGSAPCSPPHPPLLAPPPCSRKSWRGVLCPEAWQVGAGRNPFFSFVSSAHSLWVLSPPSLFVCAPLVLRPCNQSLQTSLQSEALDRPLRALLGKHWDQLISQSINYSMSLLCLCGHRRPRLSCSACLGLSVSD